MAFPRLEQPEDIDCCSRKAPLGLYEARIQSKNSRFLAIFSYFIIYTRCIDIMYILAVPFDSPLISILISLFKIVVAILEVIL
jgi:hypothetical protein